jgi:hypothetical protein
MEKNYKLSKSTLKVLRRYAKTFKYNVFLDKKELKTCIYSKRSKKRVFVKQDQDGNIIAVDDNGNEEIITTNIKMWKTNPLNINNGNRVKMREVVYGIISLF